MCEFARLGREKTVKEKEKGLFKKVVDGEDEGVEYLTD